MYAYPHILPCYSYMTSMLVELDDNTTRKMAALGKTIFALTAMAARYVVSMVYVKHILMVITNVHAKLAGKERTAP